MQCVDEIGRCMRAIYVFSLEMAIFRPFYGLIDHNHSYDPHETSHRYRCHHLQSFEKRFGVLTIGWREIYVFAA